MGPEDSAGSVPSAHTAVDSEVYQDLLVKAKGDHKLAAKWMAEIGGSVAQKEVEGLISDTAPRDLDAAAAEAGAPPTFFCPISFRLFRNPVCLQTGQTYERRYLEEWLSQGNLRCPVTGQALSRPVILTPNVALRKSVEEWAEKNAPYLLNKDGSLKPIPEADDFSRRVDVSVAATTAASTAATTAATADLALAIRMQEEELARAGSALHGPRRIGGRSTVRRTRQQRISHFWTNVSILLLTAANITLFLLAFAKSSWSFDDIQQNPFIGPSQSSLYHYGALSSSSITDVHQWWRIVTSIWLNPGLIMLFGTISSIWTFGKYLEAVLPMPWLSIPFVYVLSGAVGALASANLDTVYVTVGASAGVLGLLGGIWADQLVNWHKFANHAFTIIVLAIVTGVFIVLGFLPLLDNFFQLGGFLCGGLTCAMILLAERGRSALGNKQGFIAGQVICAALIAAMVGVGIAGLALGAGPGKACRWCPDFSCIDLSWWNCNYVTTSGGGCKFESNSSGQALMTCPNGDGHTVSLNGTSSQMAQDLCTSICSGTSQGGIAPGGPGFAEPPIASGSPTAAPGSSGEPGVVL